MIANNLYATAAILEKFTCTALTSPGDVVKTLDGECGIVVGINPGKAQADINDVVSIAVDGLVELPKASGTTLAAGQRVSWDATNKLLVATAGDFEVGTVIAVLTTTRVLVRLNNISAINNPITLAAANGAIAVAPGTVVITKGSIAAMTLAAPVATQNGLILRVTSASAFAHTITATGLIDNGVTGGSKTTATFAAFAGATIELMAYEGKWHVISLNAVTVA